MTADFAMTFGPLLVPQIEVARSRESEVGGGNLAVGQISNRLPARTNGQVENLPHEERTNGYS